MYSFKKLKSDDSVFASVFEIIKSNLDLKTAHVTCMQHLCLDRD